MPVSVEPSVVSSPDTRLLPPLSLGMTLRTGAFLCFAGHGAFGIIGTDSADSSVSP